MVVGHHVKSLHNQCKLNQNHSSSEIRKNRINNSRHEGKHKPTVQQ